MIPEFLESKEIDAVVKDFKLFFLIDKQLYQLIIKKRVMLEKRHWNNLKILKIYPLIVLALNLISVHPDLIEFARQALKTNDVRLYQARSLANYRRSDFDQAFHCDFGNHIYGAV